MVEQIGLRSPTLNRNRRSQDAADHDKCAATAMPATMVKNITGAITILIMLMKVSLINFAVVEKEGK